MDHIYNNLPHFVVTFHGERTYVPLFNEHIHDQADMVQLLLIKRAWLMYGSLFKCDGQR